MCGKVVGVGNQSQPANKGERGEPIRGNLVSVLSPVPACPGMEGGGGGTKVGARQAGGRGWGRHRHGQTGVVVGVGESWGWDSQVNSTWGNLIHPIQARGNLWGRTAGQMQ